MSHPFRKLTVACFLIATASGWSAEPEFTRKQLEMPGKKGACFTLRDKVNKRGRKPDAVENAARIKALNVYWNYTWGGRRSAAQPADIEFVPMVWGAWDKQKLKNYLATAVVPEIQAGRAKRLLGFNEPDKKKQANMTYKQALKYWPLLESMNVPLASPGCANTEGINDDTAQGVKGTWMRDFMREVDKRGYRVDYIAVHAYHGTSAKHFKAKMKRIYEKYGRRPLLITEFAVADWKAKTPEKNRYSQAKVLAFMKEVLPWLEKQDFIAGYSWFPFSAASAAGTHSALFDEDGKLTACGRYYASITTENPNGNQSIKPDDARK